MATKGERVLLITGVTADVGRDVAIFLAKIGEDLGLKAF